MGQNEAQTRNPSIAVDMLSSYEFFCQYITINSYSAVQTAFAARSKQVQVFSAERLKWNRMSMTFIFQNGSISSI